MGPVPPLRAVRIAQGKGLREVATRTQIDPAQLSRVEQGMGSLSVEALGRLARELDLKELTRLLGPIRERASDEPTPYRAGGGCALERE